MSLNLKGNIQVRIIKCESGSAEEANLECFIWVNRMSVNDGKGFRFGNGETGKENSESVVIQSECELRFMVKRNAKDYIGSVTINSSAFPVKGLIWLPLSDNIDHDSILKISMDFTARILISVQTYKNTTPIESEMKVKQLNYSVTELSQRLKTALSLYQKEKSANGRLHTNNERLIKEREEYIVKFQQRELSLLKLLELKDCELQERSGKEVILQHKYETLLIERNSLKDSLDKIKESSSSGLIPQLNTEIESLKSTIQSLLDKEKHTLLSLQSIGQTWLESTYSAELSPRFNELTLKAEILELSESNKLLQNKILSISKDRELLSSRVFELEECQFLNSKASGSLDSILNNSPYKDLIIKIGQDYYFNHIKIQLGLQDTQIVVNNIPIDQYLQFSSALQQPILKENNSKSFLLSPPKSPVAIKERLNKSFKDSPALKLKQRK